MGKFIQGMGMMVGKNLQILTLILIIIFMMSPSLVANIAIGAKFIAKTFNLENF